MAQGARYWISAAASSMDPSLEHSWEEHAFAEDASRSLAVWPPKSYSCSFCKREFKSAQALGGHMNVHKRERAALFKHALNPRTSLNYDINPHDQGTCALSSDEEEVVSCKRRRLVEAKPLSFFPDLMMSTRIHDTSFCRQYSSGPVEEELDLELRLGSANAPKVKQINCKFVCMYIDGKD